MSSVQILKKELAPALEKTRKGLKGSHARPILVQTMNRELKAAAKKLELILTDKETKELWDWFASHANEAQEFPTLSMLAEAMSFKPKTQDLEVKYKLYTEDPYGNGFMKAPVRRGEVLTTADGEHVVFSHVSADGRKAVVVVNGKDKIMSLKTLGARTLPGTEKPSGKGWA